MNKIYAVDFDGTLCENAYPEIGKPYLHMIDYFISAKKRGSKIILWTCREGKELEEAVAWCTSHGLIFDAVNDNVPEVVESFGGNHRKIFAHEYIDDRAFNPWR